MKSNKIAIVGMGFVGKGMLKIFPNAYQYDRTSGEKGKVNECDLAIVCVPTPVGADGSCDTSIVEEVVSWIECPLILIKSTIEPGTTERLCEKYKKHIAFSPEYMGESRYFVPQRFLEPTNPLSHEFLILGGDEHTITKMADVFAPVVGPVTRIRLMRATEAELIKYAENAFFATKVMFANQLRDICDLYGANWHRVREGWIDDPRIGAMHTAVFPEDRGYDGKCYPKDVLAIYRAAQKKGYEPTVIKGVLDGNARYKS